MPTGGFPSFRYPVEPDCGAAASPVKANDPAAAAAANRNRCLNVIKQAPAL